MTEKEGFTQLYPGDIGAKSRRGNLLAPSERREPWRRVALSAGLAAAGVAFLSGCGFHKFFSPSGWRQPERVVAALSLEPGARVADVGAGDGSREMTDAGFRRTQVFDFLPMLHFQVFSPE